MKLIHLLPIFLTLVFALSPLAAQETTDTGWPIEERCLGEPTLPPDDWTFPGAILMTGRYGIHAVSEAVPTPYVVAFLGRDSLGADGTELSPDGKWYAIRVGETGENGLSGYQRTNAIRVYSTDGSREVHEIPWQNTFVYGSTGIGQRSIIWWDNEQLLYETSVEDQFAFINPFTNEIQKWNYQVYPFDINYQFFNSPDWSRVIKNSGGVYNNQWALYEPVSGERIVELNLSGETIWKPNSSQFAAETAINHNDELINQITLFDKDGQQAEVIFSSITGEQIINPYGAYQNAVWSPDGRYLAFVTTTFADPTINLYIADMQEKRVHDTCIETSDGLAWSPDSNMLAMMDFYDYKPHRPVMVLDLDTWAVHTVAYHAGSVIGWRED